MAEPLARQSVTEQRRDIMLKDMTSITHTHPTERASGRAIPALLIALEIGVLAGPHGLIHLVLNCCPHHGKQVGVMGVFQATDAWLASYAFIGAVFFLVTALAPRSWIRPVTNAAFALIALFAMVLLGTFLAGDF